MITGVISMVLIFIAKVTFKDYFQATVTAVVPPYDKGSLVDSVSIILTAYGFIVNFYPIYSNIEKRSYSKGI